MLTAFVVCGIAALAGGFIDAIAGGGGLLTVPALLICGVPPHIALGTNKISAFLGTSVALFNFARNGLVRWRLAFYGIAFSLAGSWAGTLLAIRLDSALLGKILIFLLPLAMAVTLLPSRKNSEEEKRVTGLKFWIYLPLLAFAMGVYDGFFGPGTGSFLILGLHWILGLGLVGASGTAKAFNLASNFSGAVSFAIHGMVNWPLGVVMAACLMIGNWGGSTLAIKIGSKAVRRFLIISLLLLLGTLIQQYFFK